MNNLENGKRKPRNRGRAGLGRVLVVFLLILLCAGLAGIVWAVRSIPRQAAAEFGAADPALSTLKRFNLSARLLWQRDELLEPYDPQGEAVPFEIAAGETAQQVSQKLAVQKIIRRSEPFLLYVIYTGMDKTIQAGKYRLSASMNLVEIAGALQDATPAEVSFSIFPGWRVEEIAASLPTSGLEVSSDDFLSLAAQPELFDLPPEWVQTGSLEGFLLPGTYVLPRKISGQELIQTFLRSFQDQLTSDLVEGFSNQGLDVFQAVTLASIVQREAVVVEEQPLIASVFINRLEIGMSLDTDPTVQYALGYNSDKGTWWKSPLSLEDLNVDSSYNTYRRAGLPPAPICSPSVTALSAVAHPAQTPYYYFRAKCDGSGRHSFAVDFQGHLNNACP